MSDILEEASRVVQCKECPWYKSCVVPMRFTVEDLRRQIPGMASFPTDESGMPKFLADLAYATQNFLLEGCPVFIERLRANPKLAERLKRMMQSWGVEEEETSQK